MCIYIGIEDLAANALIELVEKSDRREVLFKQLDEYGTEIVKYLNKNHEQAILIFSKERTSEFLKDYSEYFELFNKGFNEGIRLRDDVSIDKLWEKFRGYLSVNVMMAFMNKGTISALGV